MQTLGEFYKEKILSRKGLVTKELPSGPEKAVIERDLFGWKLYVGKKYIECRSEEEARYLKVFHAAGLRTVKVPRKYEYLKELLPELETLKKKIDEIVSAYTMGILSRKLRQKARGAIWSEIMKEAYEEFKPKVDSTTS